VERVGGEEAAVADPTREGAEERRERDDGAEHDQGQHRAGHGVEHRHVGTVAHADAHLGPHGELRVDERDLDEERHRERERRVTRVAAAARVDGPLYHHAQQDERDHHRVGHDLGDRDVGRQPVADHAQAGADQFEKYHSFDSVDRENGIWRYFCHHRAEGREKARQQLLRYEKDDRPPFREVYQLFQGSLTAEAVMAAAQAGTESTRPQRQFNSYLYVGLNASLEGDRRLAETALAKAVLNDWGRRAGYGPNYMWHVGRLELNRLQNPKPAAAAAPAK